MRRRRNGIQWHTGHVPVTFPAHQGLIVAAKLRWPHRIDGTALCIGAAAPDFAYPLGPWLNGQSHTLLGLLVWSLPVTFVLTEAVRRGAAEGVFANLPDLGPLRLRSYRVLGQRRHSFAATATGAGLGAGSHVLIDAFTHAGRWGADALDLNDVVATVPIRGEMTEARVLQYLGHVGGTFLFLAALLMIASTRRLERWYGQVAVAEARRRAPTLGGPFLFWGLVLLCVIVAIGLAHSTGRSALFAGVTATAFSIVVVGALVARPGSRAELSVDVDEDGGAEVRSTGTG